MKKGWIKPIIGNVYNITNVRTAHSEVIEHSGGSTGNIVVQID